MKIRRERTRCESWLWHHDITLGQIASKVGVTKTAIWMTVRDNQTGPDGNRLDWIVEMRGRILSALHEMGFDVSEKELW